jgi:hypothetical protein
MGRARRLHVPVAAAGLVLALVAALAAAGCGSSDTGTTESPTTEPTRPSPTASQAPAGAAMHGCTVLTRKVHEARATGVACTTAVEVADAWMAESESDCRLKATASRGSCTVGRHRYRCLATSTDRGIAVSCSRPGRTISFLAPPG